MKYTKGDLSFHDYMPPEYEDIPEIMPLVTAIHDAIVNAIEVELPEAITVGFGGSNIYVDLYLGDETDQPRWVFSLAETVANASGWNLGGGHGTDRPEVLKTIKAFRDQADWLENLVNSYESGVQDDNT